MAHHPVVRTDAALGDVPRALQGLERLEVVEPVPAPSASTSCWTWTVVGRYAHRTPPGSSTSASAPSMLPRVGQVQHRPVEALAGAARPRAGRPRGARARPGSSRRTPRCSPGPGPGARDGPRRRRRAPEGPRRGTARRERARARARLQDARAREDVCVRPGSARGPSGRRPGRPAASSARSPRSAGGTPISTMPWPSQTRRPPAARSAGRVRACPSACGTWRRSPARTGTSGRGGRRTAPAPPPRTAAHGACAAPRVGARLTFTGGRLAHRPAPRAGDLREGRSAAASCPASIVTVCVGRWGSTYCTGTFWSGVRSPRTLPRPIGSRRPGRRRRRSRRPRGARHPAPGCRRRCSARTRPRSRRAAPAGSRRSC